MIRSLQDFAIVGMAWASASPTPGPGGAGEAQLLRQAIDQACRDAGAFTWEQRWDTALFISGADHDAASLSATDLGLECVYQDRAEAADTALTALSRCLHSLSADEYAVGILAVVCQDHDETTKLLAGTPIEIHSLRSLPAAQASPPAIAVAAAVAFKRRDWAEACNDKVYAYLRAFSLISPEEKLANLKRTYQEAAITPDTIGLLETVQNRDVDGIDAATLAMIETVFGTRIPGQARWPLCLVRPAPGQTSAGAGIAAVMQAVLCLSSKQIAPGSYDERWLVALGTTPFYLNQKVSVWKNARSLSPRRAAVNIHGPGDNTGHILLEEVPEWDPLVRSRHIHRLSTA